MPKAKKKSKSPSHRKSRAGKKFHKKYQKTEGQKKDIWTSKQQKKTHITQHLKSGTKIIQDQKAKNWTLQKSLESRKKKSLKKVNTFVNNLLSDLKFSPNHTFSLNKKN